MRKVATIALALITFSAIGVLTNPLVPSVAQAGCTEQGTSNRDILAGTKQADKICARGGGDYVHGNAGRDEVLGQKGRDTLVGGTGADRIKGGPGSDKLFSIDQKANDIVRGGAGRDSCFIDQGDLVAGCETIHVGNTSSTTNALSNTVLGVSILAGEPEPSPTVSPSPIVPPPPWQTSPPAVPPGQGK